MFDLSGRSALVTGASGGIGEAVARQLHAQGATVVLAGRRRDTLTALAEALGERVRVEVAELSDPQAAEQLIAAADADGGPDVLINNAGLTRDNLALRMKDEDWQTVLEVNLTAASGSFARRCAECCAGAGAASSTSPRSSRSPAIPGKRTMPRPKPG